MKHLLITKIVAMLLGGGTVLSGYIYLKYK